MTTWSRIRELTPDQRNTFFACFLGWTLDAFDYFVLVFVIKDIAREFHTDKTHVALALTLTLAMRPVGALLFGRLADRHGRRMVLMIDVVLYSVLELASGFAPTLTIFLILRALFGIAMGGEWGLGASLVMESIPAELRGLASGILQEGYVVGYLLGAIVYPFIAPTIGWRYLFFLGAVPALLSLFIRAKVKESPVWLETRAREPALDPRTALQRHGKIFLYMVVLMACFNFMSHGTQDLYPTFLQVQMKFSDALVSHIVIIYNVGALIGGIFFGCISQWIGRRQAIVAAALLALPVIPLWAFSHTAASLAVGGFLMQFMVQGAWGSIPAHLNELSPNALRATLPGFAYQLGNLVAASNVTIQTALAEHYFHNFSQALITPLIPGIVIVSLVTYFGPEGRDIRFGE